MESECRAAPALGVWRFGLRTACPGERAGCAGRPRGAAWPDAHPLRCQPTCQTGGPPAAGSARSPACVEAPTKEPSHQTKQRTDPWLPAASRGWRRRARWLTTHGPRVPRYGSIPPWCLQRDPPWGWSMLVGPSEVRASAAGSSSCLLAHCALKHCPHSTHGQRLPSPMEGHDRPGFGWAAVGLVSPARRPLSLPCCCCNTLRQWMGGTSPN